jgi:D-alanyl-D-alanine carboxypeptidase/D-alanyl-D-alanine-endopeptidase (penicillin-binding protein 4)
LVKHLHIFFYLFLFPFLIHAQLNRVVEDWKNDKELKNASISFCVLDVNTSGVILEQNSHQSLIPASTLKVVTTSAALGILGKDFRYETKIFYTGSLDKKTGVLDGNILWYYSLLDPIIQEELAAAVGVTSYLIKENLHEIECVSNFF